MQDTAQASYRGVKCLYCRQPIPVSPLICRTEVEVKTSEATPSPDQKCRVFNLRCPACGKEKPYKIGEIQEIDGAQINIGLRAKPASSRTGQLGNRAKAANG